MAEKVTIIFDDGEEREYDFPTKEEIDAEFKAVKAEAAKMGFDFSKMVIDEDQP